jgi:hypothetical protein
MSDQLLTYTILLTDRPGEDLYQWDFERLESWRAPGSALRRFKPNVALPPKESLTQADLSVRLLLYHSSALNPAPAATACHSGSVCHCLPASAAAMVLHCTRCCAAGICARKRVSLWFPCALPMKTQQQLQGLQSNVSGTPTS